MKSVFSKLKYLLIGAGLMVASTAFAVQVTVPSAPSAGYALISTSTGAYIATTTNPFHAGYFWATSNTASQFPYASTTAITSVTASTSNQYIGTSLCTGGKALQVDATGLVNCGTITGGGSGTVTNIATTYPVLGGSITTTGTISLDFGTTTNNLWSGTNIFQNASTTVVGNLNIGGNATSTAFFATVASTTNLSGTFIKGFGLTTCSGTNALTWTGNVFGCAAQPQGTVTSVTGTWPITSSGGATPAISWSGLASSSNLATSQVLYATGVNTYQSVGTSTPGITAPLQYSSTLGNFIGGSNGNFSISQSGVSADGYLSAINFKVFNNKIGTSSNETAGQLAYFTTTSGTPPLLSGVASTSFPTLGLGLTNTGTFGSLVGGNASTLSIATSSLFTGTLGQFPWFSGTNSLIGTSSIFVSSTNSNVGIGSTTPSVKLSVAGGPISNCETIGPSQGGATSTSMTVDLSKNCNSTLLRMGGSAFTVTITSLMVGQTARIIVANPGGTAGAITWVFSGGTQWCGDTDPTQTTAANKGDVWSILGTQATSTTAGAAKAVICNTGI